MLRLFPPLIVMMVGEAEKNPLFSCWIYCHMKGSTALNLWNGNRKTNEDAVNNSHSSRLFVIIHSLSVFLLFVIRLQSFQQAQTTALLIRGVNPAPSLSCARLMRFLCWPCVHGSTSASSVAGNRHHVQSPQDGRVAAAK